MVCPWFCTGMARLYRTTSPPCLVIPSMERCGGPVPSSLLVAALHANTSTAGELSGYRLLHTPPRATHAIHVDLCNAGLCHVNLHLYRMFHAVVVHAHLCRAIPLRTTASRHLLPSTNAVAVGESAEVAVEESAEVAAGESAEVAAGENAGESVEGNAVPLLPPPSTPRLRRARIVVQ